jgi:hypothetical protein
VNKMPSWDVLNNMDHMNSTHQTNCIPIGIRKQSLDQQRPLNTRQQESIAVRESAMKSKSIRFFADADEHHTQISYAGKNTHSKLSTV